MLSILLLLLCAKIIGSELWEDMFDGLFSLVKYVVDVWEIGKHNYTIMTEDLVNSILSLHLGIWLGLKGRDKLCQNGKLGHSCARVMKGRLYESRVKDHVCI